MGINFSINFKEHHRNSIWGCPPALIPQLAKAYCSGVEVTERDWRRYRTLTSFCTPLAAMRFEISYEAAHDRGQERWEQVNKDHVLGIFAEILFMRVDYSRVKDALCVFRADWRDQMFISYDTHPALCDLLAFKQGFDIYSDAWRELRPHIAGVSWA